MFQNKDYILAIYREGGFSKAAAKLYISQPSLSASVKRIEDQLGVPLFDRSTTPVSLTEAGREYVKYALEIEEKEQDFMRYIGDYARMLTGAVRIGGSSLFSSFLLPQMIAAFNKNHPQIHFEITENSTKALMEELKLGALDIVIDNTPVHDAQILQSVYKEERILLAVPSGFEINRGLKEFRLTAHDIKEGAHLSDQYAVPLTRFVKEPFIVLNPDNDTGKRAAHLFKKHRMKPEIRFCLDQQVTAFNISGTGMGVSFVSDTLIQRMSTEPALYFYRLPDPETKRFIYFYRKKNHYLSLACRRFIEEVNQE